MPTQKDKREIGDSRIDVVNRIKEFYTKELNINRAEFARQIDFSYHSIRAYERGESEPGSLFYKKLYLVYPQADIVYFLTGKRSKTTRSYGVNDVVHVIPVVDSIPPIEEEAVPKEMTIGLYELPNYKNFKKVFVYKVRGKAAVDPLRENDYIIATAEKAITNGETYLLTYKGNPVPMVRNVYKASGGYRLVSDDIAVAPFTIKTSELVSFYRVLEISRRFPRKNLAPM